MALGAFGAHGLKGMLTPELKSTYETAARYHMYHAVGIIVSSFAFRLPEIPAALVQWAIRMFTAGIILFSGSLYALSLSGQAWLGAIAPFGGLALRFVSK